MLDQDDPALIAQLNEWAVALGTQKEAAEKSGIPYATLQRMLKGRSKVTFERAMKLAQAAGGDLAALQKVQHQPCTQRQLQHHLSEASQPQPIIGIPALTVTASAGGGSLVDGEELASGPFYFAESWLRSAFGSIAPLRVIKVQGSSQEPDLREGDWVMIDQSKTEVEDGLAVLRLDDTVLIKRLQRDGHILHLISRNQEYVTTSLDLRKDEDRLKIIGKVVYSFRAS